MKDCKFGYLNGGTILANSKCNNNQEYCNYTITRNIAIIYNNKEYRNYTITRNIAIIYNNKEYRNYTMMRNIAIIQ